MPLACNRHRQGAKVPLVAVSDAVRLSSVAFLGTFGSSREELVGLLGIQEMAFFGNSVERSLGKPLDKFLGSASRSFPTSQA